MALFFGLGIERLKDWVLDNTSYHLWGGSDNDHDDQFDEVVIIVVMHKLDVLSQNTS
jgi:hypothetical protein